MQGKHPTQHEVSTEHECPHCTGDAVHPDDCASYCASAVALMPIAFSISRSMCAVHSMSAAVPLHSRFDIPPTPPPIA